MNSNWTGRFPRTSREAFGFSDEPHHTGDHAVGIGAAFLAGFALALLILGVI
jgi:hypothetical protein